MGALHKTKRYIGESGEVFSIEVASSEGESSPVYTVQQTDEDHPCGAGWWIHKNGRLNLHVRTINEVPDAIMRLDAPFESSCDSSGTFEIADED